LRLEFGPKDAAKSVVSFSRRDTGAKGTMPLAEIASQVAALLEKIQQEMYDRANESFTSHRTHLTDWEKVLPALNDRNVVIIPFCEEPSCEDQIKEKTKSEEHRELGPDGKPQPSMGMKSLCIPFNQVSLFIIYI
jgi:prolyl-tRNA synthetase